jgi:Ca2+-transporting ATPase
VKNSTIYTDNVILNIIIKRAEKEPLFTIGLPSNKFLLGAVILTFVLQMLTIYGPLLNAIFKTQHH